jgi:hypothetical protein
MTRARLRRLSRLLVLLFAACSYDPSIPEDELDEEDDPFPDPPQVDAESPADALASPDAPTLAGAVVPGFCASYPPANLGSFQQSTRVFYGADGFLKYASDASKNRIPDFSHAGYRAGEQPLPFVAEVATVGPGAGDDTARVQAAIDAVAARTPDAKGHRGALRMLPGVYEISGTLKVSKSGVVLRGSGHGGNSAVDTLIKATGNNPHQRNVISLGAGGGSGWRNPVANTQVNVTTGFVPVGSRSFEVDKPERLAVGKRVILRHPSTSAWIAALGGGGATSGWWTPGAIDIYYVRRVTAIVGKTVTLDVPVFNHLDKSLSQSVVYVINDASLVREAGVENLRIDIQTAGGSDENHAWTGVSVAGATDSWVSDVTVLHFGYAGIKVSNADHITVLRGHAFDPVSLVTGSRRYNFSVDDFAQNVLFVEPEAKGARHAFVSNGTSTVSGVVFLRGKAQGGHTTSEGHRKWSQGLLFDSIVETGGLASAVVGLYNRGNYGTQHGWSSAHSVLWRYSTGGKKAILQKPPTAQNYAIGVIGPVTASGPFAGGPGHVETIPNLAPGSLYEAQLCDRLKKP